ncbi:MAG: hypothetical protein JWN61_2604 [Pseudonocardiales bacterium]|nr:hypothetical protein [Pseudonocardiales bacterium]
MRRLSYTSVTTAVLPRAKRIGAATAVGALGALGIALVDQQAAGADTTPLGRILAVNANGADVYTTPPSTTADIPADPDFGTTKVTARVLPVEGTFPVGSNLGGVEFSLVGDTDPEISESCFTDPSGMCRFDSVPGNQTYTLTQASQPAGIFPVLPGLAVTVGKCVIPLNDDSSETCGGIFTNDNDFAFENRGPNRQVILGLTSSVTFAPELAGDHSLPPFVTGLLSGATFEVTPVNPPPAPDAVDPLAVGADEPGVLPASATTDAFGTLTFKDSGETILFPPGNYLLHQVTPAAGYVPIAGPIPFTVGAPTTLDQALAPKYVDLLNDPNIPAPVLVADAYSTIGYGEIPLDVLLNDELYGADAYILGVTSVNGSAVRVDAASDCAPPVAQCKRVIHYTPAAGLLGPDVLQYLVATRGGTATSTATVTVSVLSPAVVVAAPILAATGPQHVPNEFGLGVSLLAVGAGLALAGSRRRSRV